eukprot:SAG22_NODE_1790_length_3569_cov_23.345821_3_plen_107_part_00
MRFNTNSKPISSTAICTYDKNPGPPGPPPPPPAPGSDYGDPADGGCKGDNKETTITGLKGNFCSPPCSAAKPCPTDVPPGTTAKVRCPGLGVPRILGHQLPLCLAS